jgi:hypothetical protein
VGANGTVLEADSAQAIGMKWGSKFTSPLTTKGDLLTYSTVAARLPVGADYRFLVPLASASTGLSWFLPPYCELYRSGSSNLLNATEYNMVWNGTTSDAWNMHPGNSATITVPVEGIYLVQVQFNMVGNYGSRRLRLYPSAGTQHISQWANTAPFAHQIYGPQAVFVCRLPASGTLYVNQYQWTNGTRNCNSSTTWTRIHVTWIGPYN